MANITITPESLHNVNNELIDRLISDAKDGRLPSYEVRMLIALKLKEYLYGFENGLLNGENRESRSAEYGIECDILDLIKYRRAAE